MPTTPHIEKHFTATDVVRDIVIGMSEITTSVPNFTPSSFSKPKM